MLLSGSARYGRKMLHIRPTILVWDGRLLYTGMRRETSIYWYVKGDFCILVDVIFFASEIHTPCLGDREFETVFSDPLLDFGYIQLQRALEISIRFALNVEGKITYKQWRIGFDRCRFPDLVRECYPRNAILLKVRIREVVVGLLYWTVYWTSGVRGERFESKLALCLGILDQIGLLKFRTFTWYKKLSQGQKINYFRALLFFLQNVHEWSDQNGPNDPVDSIKLSINSVKTLSQTDIGGASLFDWRFSQAQSNMSGDLRA